MSKLESQLTQVQEDLKKTKELLSSSESSKIRALEEADEARKQYLAMAANFEDTKRQLLELSRSEAASAQELQEPSENNDQALESESKSPTERASFEPAAVDCAINEIENLKLQIEMAVESEEGQSMQAELAHSELQTLKRDVVETSSLVGTLKAELNDYEKSEADYQELVSETQLQLQVANSTIQTLHSDGLKVVGAFKAVCSDLEASKCQINSLENLVGVLQSEVENLKSALEASEIRLKEEQINSTVQICSAEETVSALKEELERLRSSLEVEGRLEEEKRKTLTEIERPSIDSGLKEDKLESTLEEANARIAELKANLVEKEDELRKVSDLNETLKREMEKFGSTTLTECELETKLKSSSDENVSEMRSNLALLKADLTEKESELQRLSSLNESLKEEIEKLRPASAEPGLETKSVEEVDELKSNLADLRASLTDKETQLQNVLVANDRLKEEVQKLMENQAESGSEAKVKASVSEVAELKENLMDKETELQSISEENKVLRAEMRKKEEEMVKTHESALAELEAAKASQRDAMTKLGQAAEEADKSSQRAAKMGEQLEATRAANSEMEAELKRLRIQTDQWRKAAEAAAAILNTGSNGKLNEKSGSIDSEYINLGGKLLSSPFSDDLDEEATKTKKNTVLKKIGVLWKKGQK